MSKTKKIALTGMLCALAVAIMMMGGLIPLATFCCPLLAGVMLIPVFVECGEKLTWGAYTAIALLSLMLCPDKEAALLFAFLGYYPILRWRIEQLRSRLLRMLVRLGVFNAAVGLMYSCAIFLLQMDRLLQEYRGMGIAMTLLTLLLGNITLLVYDKFLANITLIYVHKLRSKLL